MIWLVPTTKNSPVNILFIYFTHKKKKSKTHKNKTKKKQQSINTNIPMTQ